MHQAHTAARTSPRVDRPSGLSLRRSFHGVLLTWSQLQRDAVDGTLRHTTAFVHPFADIPHTLWTLVLVYHLCLLFKFIHDQHAHEQFCVKAKEFKTLSQSHTVPNSRSQIPTIRVTMHIEHVSPQHPNLQCKLGLHMQ